MTKIVVVSDTHSYHRKLKIPPADIFIHAGDITWRGEMEIIGDFANWLKELPCPNKVVIFGNHELGMQSGPKRPLAIQMIEQAGAIYLENSGTNIEGLNIWGSPVTPYFMDWEWNLPRDGTELRKTWDMIPDNTNILITHGPPYGILDNVIRTAEPQGCKLLKKKAMQLPNLKLMVFGHLHDGFGIKPVANTIFVNAAMCDDKYNVSREPVVIDL